MANREKAELLLVLDLDETLVHSTKTELDRPADFRLYDYHVYERPDLGPFLDWCLKAFPVAVWSSASDDYVAALVERLFPDPAGLEFVWARSRTATLRTQPHHMERFGAGLRDYHFQKRLRKLAGLGWTIDRILIVDDSPEKAAQNYGNAIYPKAFLGAEDDDELRYLASYLDRLRTVPNPRSVEKRNWRATVVPMVWDGDAPGA